MSSFVLAIVAMMILVPTVAAGQDPFMIGTWEWISTSYTAGGEDTPATVSYTLQISFNEDHTFLTYRDEVPQMSTYWAVGEVYAPPAFIQFTMTGEGDTWWDIDFSYDGTLYMTLRDYQALPSGSVGPNTKTELYRQRSPVATETFSWGDLKAGFR
ncbi:MAG: hypothetical protein IPK64_18045 [bacterium]|nr:hypothetical protein [bacterium]